MDAHRKWLDDEGDTLAQPEESQSPVVVGARQERRQLDFRPRKGNPHFNGGRGKSVEYGYLIDIDYALDFTELVLTYSLYRVTIRGRNLEGLLHRIQSHHAALVVETGDAMHAARVQPDRQLVTGLAMEPRAKSDEE